MEALKFCGYLIVGVIVISSIVMSVFFSDNSDVDFDKPIINNEN